MASEECACEVSLGLSLLFFAGSHTLRTSCALPRGACAWCMSGVRYRFGLACHIRFVRALDSLEARRDFVRVKLLAVKLAMCFFKVKKDVCCGGASDGMVCALLT